jgi:hypothetical protein
MALVQEAVIRETTRLKGMKHIIGNTPLLAIRYLYDGRERYVYAKVRLCCPAVSFSHALQTVEFQARDLSGPSLCRRSSMHERCRRLVGRENDHLRNLDM